MYLDWKSSKPMKRSIFALSCLFLAGALLGRAQVAPSAYASRLNLTAGGEFSLFQPDYAGRGIAETSPNRLYGIGAYVDADFNRWVKVEAEGRWLRFNQYLGISEDSYLIGPRLAPKQFFGKITPYGKVMVGLADGSFLTARTLAVAYGGGADYRLSRRFTARADFEYQQWHVTPNLYPYGVSFGIGYKIF